ncbi:CDP-alcohol phosphatidyltransferase family protein [Sphingobium estronivorans]|uniref:CDP-alcohol phosphatidyltransferase family protein n=1 Tax=Sphingobium estronivorans TaxID=1577690 RepID=UPI00123B45B0|nr:CDP-alcohol phosphatidyltransferase family protein [Sphingobium estronivorans]
MSQLSVRLIGDNPTRIWSISCAERVHRIAKAAGFAVTDSNDGPTLLINSAFAFDPQWLGFMKLRPNAVLTIDGVPAIAHITGNNEEAAQALLSSRMPAGLQPVAAEDHKGFYNKSLRKKEWPFLLPLTPANVPAIERASYQASYKGVTDLLTKYLWPELAFHLTRLAARIGLSPNMVTGIGALCCIAATFLFAQGLYWTGFLIGFLFMVLDTVDGKLARCTITSSKWGNIFDHGVDLIHPPFWWFAWGLGLQHWGLALSPEIFWMVMGVILGGYVLQRLIEGTFMRAFNGMHIHVWRRFDTRFRLITARRNPNMVILFVALLFGRPDLGLIGIAWWTGISLLVHAVQLLQAHGAKRAGQPVVSWMEPQA